MYMSIDYYSAKNSITDTCKNYGLFSKMCYVKEARYERVHCKIPEIVEEAKLI